MVKVTDRVDKLVKKVAESLREKGATQQAFELANLEYTLGNKFWLEQLTPEQLDRLVNYVMKPANEWLLDKMGLHVQIVTYQTVEHR